MTANIKHSKGSVRWGSDEDLVERSRRVMGGIDLDPCTEAVFEPTVKATKNYSLLDRGENGLLLPWSGRVYCNHPGGLTLPFWKKLVSEPDVTQCIWIGFNMDQLCLLADELLHPVDFSMCFLRKRRHFKRHDGYKGSPSHNNYVTGLGTDPKLFEQEFGGLGKVTHGKCVVQKP